ncbi:MAG: hypothetical protein ACRC33_25985, partial [Gemmataceae bacterium]
GAVSPAVLALVPLMKDAETGEVVRRWVELAGGLADEGMKADVGGIARVFAKLAGRQGVWYPILEGWMMERSEFLMERDEKAEVRAFRRGLVNGLKEKFPDGVPMEVLNRIQAEERLDTLEYWSRKSSVLTDIAEVRKLLGLLE